VRHENFSALTQQFSLRIEYRGKLPGQLTEIGAAEGPGHAEPVVHLFTIRVLCQVRQPPPHPGLQLRRDIMEDPGEVVIGNLPAFITGSTFEPSEPVLPRVAPSPVIGVIRHSDDPRRSYHYQALQSLERPQQV
jgi:hypothetical protein